LAFGNIERLDLEKYKIMYLVLHGESSPGWKPINGMIQYNSIINCEIFGINVPEYMVQFKNGDNTKVVFYFNNRSIWMELEYPNKFEDFDNYE